MRAQQQLEQLQARYIGTGHADTTKFEWTSNMHRDSYASYIGHPPLLEYMAIGMGEAREKVRAQLIEVGPSRAPPPKPNNLTQSNSTWRFLQALADGHMSSRR